MTSLASYRNIVDFRGGGAACVIGKVSIQILSAGRDSREISVLAI